MAKGLRSKSKRRTRAIARIKKAPKEHKRLEEAVARREAFDAAEAEKKEEELPAASEANGEQMETGKDATINLKTMKLADGSYPVWLSQRHIKKMKNKNLKQQKAKKPKGR